MKRKAERKKETLVSNVSTVPKHQSLRASLFDNTKFFFPSLLWDETRKKNSRRQTVSLGQFKYFLFFKCIKSVLITIMGPHWADAPVRAAHRIE